MEVSMEVSPMEVSDGGVRDILKATPRVRSRPFNMSLTPRFDTSIPHLHHLDLPHLDLHLDLELTGALDPG